MTAPLDLTALDGDIIATGLELGTFRGGVRLSKAEVLQLVRFAAELWPDQVVKVVHDAGVGAEAADLELRAQDALTPCGTGNCLSHATHECFWPGQTVKMCESCTARARGIAAAMGFDLVVRELVLPIKGNA